MLGRTLAETVHDPEDNSVLLKRNKLLDEEAVEKLSMAEIESVKVARF